MAFVFLDLIECDSSNGAFILVPLCLCFNDCSSSWLRPGTGLSTCCCCKSQTAKKKKKKTWAESSIRLAELSALSTLLPRLNKAQLLFTQPHPPPPAFPTPPHPTAKLFSQPPFSRLFLLHSQSLACHLTGTRD